MTNTANKANFIKIAVTVKLTILNVNCYCAVKLPKYTSVLRYYFVFGLQSTGPSTREYFDLLNVSSMTPAQDLGLIL